MICKSCGVKMKYDFQVDDQTWKKAWKKIGKPKTNRPDGVLCAHCFMNALGLKVWKVRECQ